MKIQMDIFQKLNKFQREKTVLFLSILFVYISTIGLLHLNDDYKKGKTDFKKFHGKEYIIPIGKELEFGDSDAYNKFAWYLIEKGDFYNPAGQKSAWITPGYSFFLASIYKIFGYSFWTIFIFQAILLSITFLLLYRLCEITFSITSAGFTLLLLVLNFKFAVYTSLIYTESLFFFLISLLLYLLFKNLNSSFSFKKAVLFGFISGFIFLVRPVVAPFLLVAGVYLLFSKKLSFHNATLLIFSALLLILPWIFRNYRIFDRFVISTNSEMSLSDGYLNLEKFSFWESYSLLHFSEVHQYKDSLFSDKIRGFKRTLNDTTVIYPQSYCFESFSNLFKEHTAQIKKKYFSRYILRSIYLFKVGMSPTVDEMSFRHKIFSVFLWCLTILPALIGLFYFYRNKSYILIFALGVSLLILPALNIIDSNLRYQLPVQLVFTILSGCFYSKLYIKQQEKETKIKFS